MRVPTIWPVVKRLLGGLDVRFETEVKGLTRDGARWRLLDAGGIALGEFDVAVVAVPPAQAATLIDPSQLDERERQEEMLEAVSRVIALDAAALPELETQHRVIGTDRCHFMAPVSAPDHGDAAGKLFLTSARVIFAGGASIAWPWHRVRRAGRQERDLIFEGGDALTLRLRCNSYGDAAVAAAIASRLTRR